MADIALKINGRQVTVPEGYTILEAAETVGIEIPRLCYLKDVHKFGSCRVCNVEVKGAKALQPACMVAAANGMEVFTNSPRARRARKVMVELLLSDHNCDCLHCERSLRCELQELARQVGVTEARFEGEQNFGGIDVSESITRDMTKCVLCRRCVSACGNIQEVGILSASNRGFTTEISPAAGLPIGSTNCTFCGQCTVVCPVGALKETSHRERVWKALANPDKYVVVQPAPAVRSSIGECFGMEPGEAFTGKLAAALRRLGFDKVFDTNWAADLTIMEEGTEFLTRVREHLTGGKAVLPMMTSCSPGWIKYIENHYPDELDHLSTCKSPHMMFGAVIKSYYAKKISKKTEDMFVVSIMPCTAKKTEIARHEMKNDGYPNVDAVLTVRELADMIRDAGIDFTALPDEQFDDPLGLSTGAADIFGITGGVMGAALRTVYEIITGRELPFPNLHVSPIVGLDRIKEAFIKLDNVRPEWAAAEGLEIRVAVTSGLAGAKQLMEQIKAGTSAYHFIEVMGCPGGCITGGGQPRSKDVTETRKLRMKALYKEDEGKKLRKSHENPDIIAFYKEWGEINGHASHEYLHTHYVPRGIYNELTDETFTVRR